MQNKKELWYIDQYVGHPKYGNVFRNFYIAHELKQKGWQVKLFSGSFSHLMYSPPTLAKNIYHENLDDIDFFWLKIKHYQGGQSIGRIRSIFEFTLRLWALRKFSPPDVIVTPSLSMVPIWMIFFLKKFIWKKQVKLIFEVRDIWPLTLTTLGNKSPYHPFVKFLAITEKRAYEKSDMVVSTLRMCEQHIRTITQKSVNFLWIDNGINISNMESPISRDLEMQIPKNKFLIGYTGSLGLANAMHYFIDAANALKDDDRFHFLVVGDGTERQNLIERATGLTNITFVNKVKKDYIQGILSLCNALYFSYANVPSLYKFGVSANKTYEYMLSGKPIILSSPPMHYNIITTAKCGIVISAENVEEIVSAAKELANLTEEERQLMGQNGKKYILKNNTYSILAAKFNTALNKLISKES